MRGKEESRGRFGEGLDRREEASQGQGVRTGRKQRGQDTQLSAKVASVFRFQRPSPLSTGS